MSLQQWEKSIVSNGSQFSVFGVCSDLNIVVLHSCKMKYVAAPRAARFSIVSACLEHCGTDTRQSSYLLEMLHVSVAQVVVKSIFQHDNTDRKSGKNLFMYD